MRRRGTELGSLIVVDDRAATLDVVSAALAGERFGAIDGARSWEEAHAAVAAGCDVLLVEVQFSDGSDCRELVEVALQLPTPPEVIIMSAHADRQLVADLAFAGVSAYLEKPLEREQLLECVERVTDRVVLAKRVARLLVGRVGLKEAQWYLRGSMNREALHRAKGSFRAAASILQVDRRYVARLADEFRDAVFSPES